LCQGWPGSGTISLLAITTRVQSRQIPLKTLRASLAERFALALLAGHWPERMGDLPMSALAGGLTRLADDSEYAVEASERVKSFLLVPKHINRPVPAIFAHHQHASQFHLGKSEVVGLKGDADQAYASELAKRGYVVIAPDALAFEERNWSKSSGYAEYFELATRLVQGRTLLSKCLHDVGVALDYLVARPEVDPLRIGFIGHSYGGKMAIWAPALDNRIRASVSNCGCVNYKQSLNRDTGVQMEFCLPGVLQFGDVEDIVRLVAPCALLLQATSDDVWSRGANTIFEHAESAFPKGKLKLGCWPGGHVFTQEMRQAAYGFLDEHLKEGGNQSM
jgi:dienelactone hydrolase